MIVAGSTRPVVLPGCATKLEEAVQLCYAAAQGIIRVQLQEGILAANGVQIHFCERASSCAARLEENVHLHCLAARGVLLLHPTAEGRSAVLQHHVNVIFKQDLVPSANKPLHIYFGSKKV